MENNIENMKMCELRAAGELEEFDRRCKSPQYVCGKCRSKAEKAEHLHNPRPLLPKKTDSYW